MTPPRDSRKWASLIRKLVAHWVDRYGVVEVRKWYVEVWNEPNLKAFWTGNQNEYFELYRVDGTLSPWAAVASLPFAPDSVLPSIRRFKQLLAHKPSRYGFYASFNPSLREQGEQDGWVSPWHYALNRGRSCSWSRITEVGPSGV